MPRPLSSRPLPVALALLCLAGCLDLPGDAPDADEATHAAALAPPPPDCDEWHCGSNSPHIATYGFHELHVRGVENAEGFSVQKFVKNGRSYQLEVKQGRIYAHAGATVLRGQALANAQIWVARRDRLYAIRITSVGTAKMLATLGGVEQSLETYELDVSDIFNDQPINEWAPLCKRPPLADHYDATADDLHRFHSVVFEGDRIDRASKKWSPVIDPKWFNIGCKGHALSKLALGGHTEAAHLAQGFQTTIAERQTYLRAVTGDYCGRGTPYTVAGQPLQWQDAHGYVAYDPRLQGLALEARWYEKGALCLNEPRVDANPTQLGDLVFQGKVRAKIAGECAIPACAGGVDSFTAGAYLLTANP